MSTKHESPPRKGKVAQVDPSPFLDVVENPILSPDIPHTNTTKQKVAGLEDSPKPQPTHYLTSGAPAHVFTVEDRAKAVRALKSRSLDEYADTSAKGLITWCWRIIGNLKSDPEDRRTAMRVLGSMIGRRITDRSKVEASVVKIELRSWAEAALEAHPELLEMLSGPAPMKELPIVVEGEVRELPEPGDTVVEGPESGENEE